MNEDQLDQALADALQGPGAPASLRSAVLRRTVMAGLPAASALAAGSGAREAQIDRMQGEYLQQQQDLRREFVRLRRNTLAIALALAFILGAVATVALPWLAARLGTEASLLAPWFAALALGVAAVFSWRDRLGLNDWI